MSGVEDTRARKRAELGLSPQRPTAKSRVARPPEANRPSWMLYLLPLGLVVIIASTVFLMLGIGNRLAGLQMQSDWSWTRLAPPDSPLDAAGATYPAEATRGERDAPAVWSLPNAQATGASTGDTFADSSAAAWSGDERRPQLRLAENFAGNETIFAVRTEPGQWRTEHVPYLSNYRMEIWPNHLAWSLLEPLPWADDVPPYRIQAAATVAGHTPWGYAGLVARVREGEQLILFAVDGRGRFSVQHMRDGVTQTAVPWTPVDALNPAGTGNVLTIEDDGETVRFFANQLPLFQMRAGEWLPGPIGIAAGARAEGVGEVRFEWFQLYDLVPN